MTIPWNNTRREKRDKSAVRWWLCCNVHCRHDATTPWCTYCRWERFEELLEEAQSTRDYDVTLAINQMVDFLLSENGSNIRDQLSVQIVDQVDQLGVDAVAFARKNVGQVRETGCYPTRGPFVWLLRLWESCCSHFGSPLLATCIMLEFCKVGSTYCMSHSCSPTLSLL